jgi:hypothetical protein
MEIWELLAKFIKLLEFYKDRYSHNLFKLMKFKFDNTIINILNMKFNEFQRCWNPWLQYEKSHHTQFLLEYCVCHNVIMKILIQSLVNPW